MSDDIFELRDGRKVELEWNDAGEMRVWTQGQSRELIGSFEFQHVGGADKHGRDDRYRVTNMHLEGPHGRKEYLHKGIGREIVKRVGGILPVVFGPDDGNTRTDGSHLTGDGPGFARGMVDEHLAAREGDEAPYWDD